MEGRGGGCCCQGPGTCSVNCVSHVSHANECVLLLNKHNVNLPGKRGEREGIRHGTRRDEAYHQGHGRLRLARSQIFRWMVGWWWMLRGRDKLGSRSTRSCWLLLRLLRLLLLLAQQEIVTASCCCCCCFWRSNQCRVIARSTRTRRDTVEGMTMRRMMITSVCELYKYDTQNYINT